MSLAPLLVALAGWAGFGVYWLEPVDGVAMPVMAFETGGLTRAGRCLPAPAVARRHAADPGIRGVHASA